MAVRKGCELLRHAFFSSEGETDVLSLTVVRIVCLSELENIPEEVADSFQCFLLEALPLCEKITTSLKIKLAILIATLEEVLLTDEEQNPDIVSFVIFLITPKQLPLFFDLSVHRVSSTIFVLIKTDSFSLKTISLLTFNSKGQREISRP